DVSRQPVEEGQQLLASVRRSGRVVRIADVDELRPRPDRGEEAVEVIGVVAERNASRLGAELRGSENVARAGRPAADDLVARVVRHEAVDRGAEEACHLRALLIAALLVALLAPVRQLAADGLRLPARDDLPHLQREEADDGVTPVYDAHSLLLSDCEQTYAGAAARGLRFGMWMARPSATSPASLIASDSVGCGAMPSATVSTVDSASIATTPASTMSVTWR